MTEDQKTQDECFDNCPLYDDGKCRTRFLLKLVHGDDFPIVGCGVREAALAPESAEKSNETTDETPAPKGADEETI